MTDVERHRAAVLHSVGDLRIDDVPMPDPGPYDVVVRIHSVGVRPAVAGGGDPGPRTGRDRYIPVRQHVSGGHRPGASGRVPLDRLVGARLPLAAAEKALRMGHTDPAVLKTIVAVSD
jgi:hypothetical protein